jgi:hypothetical protein
MKDMSQIREHMEVIASDGQQIGTVDRIEGNESIKLTRIDPMAKGMHHIIPTAWVSDVDDHVHLSVASKDVFENWIEA